MIGALARKFFGSANDRRVKGYQSRVNAINALEPELVKLTDDQLKARTAEFKQQLASGKTLDDILVPAFAHGARGRQADARPAPFRRSADRRHGAA
ncbi:preprotein translocase subunit SecA [Bradyrhizobium elkanii]